MEYKRICVLGPNKPFFGARLIQMPIFQHLRANYPSAHILLYSPVQEADLFQTYGLVDEVRVYKKGSFKSILSLTQSVRSYKPELIINCREYSESLHLVVALAGKSFKIGFTPSTSFLAFFYNKTIPYNIQQYRAVSYLKLIEQLNLKNKFEFEKIIEFQSKSSLALPDRSFVCLIPGGGEGEHKRWGIQNFLALCHLLIKENPEVICYFILGFLEEEYIKEIESSLPEQNRIILFKGKLEDMIKVIGASSVVIANDCGPSHLAQMIGVNYLSVWGWEKQDPYARIAEWFHKRPNATHVVAETNMSIKTIQATKVFETINKLFPHN